MRITIGMVAVVITAVFVGLFVLPDYIFFPLMAVAALLGGLGIFKISVGWSVALLALSAVFGALGVKCMRDHRRAEEEEASRAEDDVRRRMGRIREDE
jgi:uncharacterized membrane protein